MFEPGMKVKIEDIGTLATCISVRGREIEVELEGERYWVLKRLCRPVKQEVKEMAAYFNGFRVIVNEFIVEDGVTYCSVVPYDFNGFERVVEADRIQIVEEQ